MFLSQDQLQEFEEFGFIKLPQLLSHTRVSKLLQTVKGLHAQHNEEAKNNFISKRKWWTDFQDSESSPRAQTSCWEIRNIVAKHRYFLDLIDIPTILLPLTQLLSENIALLGSHLMIRNQSNISEEKLLHTPLAWHRDLGRSFFEMTEPHSRIAVKVAFWMTPLSGRGQGAMRVIPGSHRLIGRPPINPNNNQPYGAIEIYAEPGDVFIFEQRLWHAGTTNISSQPRICMFYSYGYRWLRPLDYSYFSDNFLRNLSPVRRQLLGNAVTELGYYMPIAEDMPLCEWLKKNGQDLAVIGRD